MALSSRISRSMQISMRPPRHSARGPNRHRPYTTGSPPGQGPLPVQTPTPPPQSPPNQSPHISPWTFWLGKIIPAWFPVIIIATGVYLTLEVTRAFLVHERLVFEARQQIEAMEDELFELQNKKDRLLKPAATDDASRSELIRGPPQSALPTASVPTAETSAEESPPRSGWWQKVWGR